MAVEEEVEEEVEEDEEEEEEGRRRRRRRRRRMRRRRNLSRPLTHSDQIMGKNKQYYIVGRLPLVCNSCDVSLQKRTTRTKNVLLFFYLTI